MSKSNRILLRSYVVVVVVVVVVRISLSKRASMNSLRTLLYEVN
jgi:hypothetical protein